MKAEISKILYLSGQDVQKLDASNMDLALKDVEEALTLVYKEEAIVPEKIAMNFGKRLEDEAVNGRINAMPGYIGGTFDIAGIKWIGSNPLNIQAGLPRASAITVLNNPQNKFPICIMNGSEISAVRTGASSGVAAKYLARKDAETLMLVGAGFQNTKQLEAIKKSVKSLKYFYVVDIVKETAVKFAESMSAKLDIEVIPLTSIASCDRQPDITVNATSAPVPVMDLSVMGPGHLHICVGGLDHPDLYKKADKIVCDAWNQVRHRASCYLAMDALAGKIDDSAIYAQQIGEIICGDKAGRENDQEKIYYKPVGMGILDLAIAVRIYRKAVKENVGVWLDY